MTNHFDRLTVQLEAAALRAARREYDGLNVELFKQTLRRPVLCLSDASDSFGRWFREHRRLELARTLLTQHGWGALVEVLKHEMAHQYVDEVLGVWDETSHGPAFRAVCEERGIDARAAGVPESAEPSTTNARVLERVAKLLSLAQSSNRHEAELAMSTAQRLMLKYNIESVLDDPKARYVFRHVGRATGRVTEGERVLAAILTEHFFVEVVWVPVWRALEAKAGSVLEVCGSAENVELAEYVHSFLSQTAERLWRDHKRAGAIDSNKGRRNFIAGVMAGFRDKLRRGKNENEQAGLVWLGDPGLRQYLRRRHPHVHWRSYGGGVKSEAFAHGRQAGRRIVLTRGLSQAPSSQPRLLPGRKS